VQVLAEPFDALRATTWATALILIFFVISHDYSMPVGQQLSSDHHDGARPPSGYVSRRLLLLRTERTVDRPIVPIGIGEEAETAPGIVLDVRHFNIMIA
jgi:hypothetical protein